MTGSRTKRVALNSFFGIIAYIINLLLTFILQRLFVKYLGYELQGLNNFFISIINTLNVAELGIGAAITFSLYKPLSDNDQEKVAAIIILFRNLYFVIGIIVLCLSIVIIPFLPSLSGGSYGLNDLIVPYAIFVCNTLLTYIFTYNQTIIVADFKNYIQSIIIAVTKIVMIGLQITVLILFRNYWLFVLIMLLISTTSNICFSIYVAKKYPYLRTFKKSKLEKQERQKIKSNVFALIYHRIGNYIMQGSDGIIISAFLGLTLLGYYSNYLTLIGAFTTLLAAIFSGMSSGFGNLIVSTDRNHVKAVFEKARFVNFAITMLMTVGIFVMSEQFFDLWLTHETVLPNFTVAFICLNFYISSYSRMLGDIRAAAGIFQPDKYLHVVMAVIKLVISLILVNFWGIAGVLIGTTVCYVAKEVIVLPWIGAKFIYGGNVRNYYMTFLKDFIITVIACIVCFLINSCIFTGNLILNFVLGIVLCVAVCTVLIVVINFKTEEFKYLLSLVTKVKNHLLSKKN